MVKNKKFALDTNIVVDILNQEEQTITSVQELNAFYLPITVCGELLFGAKNSNNPLKNKRKYLKFIKSCKILQITLQVALMYSNVRKQLRNIGRPIPENDIWIAATCLANDISLITHDKHFKAVAKLKVKSIPI